MHGSSEGHGIAAVAHLLFAESSSVPYSNCLIQRGRDNEIVRGVKGGAHDVVVVPRQDTQTGTLGVIPKSQCLIITGTQQPRKRLGVGMELNCPDIIQVPQKSKETTAEFVIPDFDFVVITSTDQQGLGHVKIDSTDGSIVLFETINDSAHAIVP